MCTTVALGVVFAVVLIRTTKKIVHRAKYEKFCLFKKRLISWCLGDLVDWCAKCTWVGVIMMCYRRSGAVW